MIGSVFDRISPSARYLLLHAVTATPQGIEIDERTLLATLLEPSPPPLAQEFVSRLARLSGQLLPATEDLLRSLVSAEEYPGTCLALLVVLLERGIRPPPGRDEVSTIAAARERFSHSALSEESEVAAATSSRVSIHVHNPDGRDIDW